MSGIDDENAVGPLGEVVVAHIGGEIGVGAGGYGVGDEFAACTAAYSYAAYSKAGDGCCERKLELRVQDAARSRLVRRDCGLWHS